MAKKTTQAKTTRKVPAKKTTVGKKFDQAKPRMDLIPPHIEEEVAKVLTFGAEKYGANNWVLVPDHEARYQAAALRHINAMKKGETHDEESGLLHAAHAICCLMFIGEVELNPEIQDG